MLTVKDIRTEIEEKFPLSAAMDWDNPGLICGRNDKTVGRVLIALDASDPVISIAADEGFDMVLTHHPLVFRAVKKINDEAAPGSQLLRLAQSDIACYAMHTNFDCGTGGMADIVAGKLGIAKTGPLEATGECAGIGFVGKLDEPVSAQQLASRVRDVFELEGAAYYDTGKPVRTVACCPGSGHGMLEFAAAAGADVLLTGDMTHHDGLDALAAGISLIDAGHYGLEQVFMEYMQSFLNRAFPELETAVYSGDPRHFV